MVQGLRFPTSLGPKPLSDSKLHAKMEAKMGRAKIFTDEVQPYPLLASLVAEALMATGAFDI